MYDIELIKCNFRKKGTSLACLSKEIGVTRSAVTQALKGQTKSPRIISAIAEDYMELYGKALPTLESAALN